MKSLQPILEAVLLVKGNDGVAVAELMQFLNVKRSMVQQAIEKLNLKYHQDPECGLQVQTFAHNRFRLVAKPQYYRSLLKLTPTRKSAQLSRSAYEVLAILGHKGAVSRRQIATIRGINSDGVVSNLVVKKLIKRVRRSDEPGRPWLYSVTTEFYKVFNLQSVPELVTNLPTNASDYQLYDD